MALLALAAPFGSTASAMPPTTVSSGANQEIQVEFTFNDSVTCNGVPLAVQTFVSILSTQQTIRSGGQTTTTLSTNIFVAAGNPCAPPFEFKTFDNGSLSMAALNSASLTGHFVFDDGAFIDLNLTFAGTDTTTQGNTTNTVRFPGFMMMVRNNGSSRNATMGGSLTWNGHLINAGSFNDPDAMISRNNSGLITIFRR